MRYNQVIAGQFIDRPNRFIAHVKINGTAEVCHVKNTGRCRELLVPGCTVYCAKSDNPNRKTLFDLIAVEKICPGEQNKTLLINMDSQAPNAAAKEWLETKTLFPGLTYLKAEYKHGSSRFDFYLEEGPRKIFWRSKGSH